MRRKAFFSFHFNGDHWRASQIRNIGVVSGNEPVSDNAWERIRRRGDAAIRAWIEKQLKGRSCTVVLIGRETASRKWVDYEIKRSWNLGKGVLGIYIHKLKNQQGKSDRKGANPFRGIRVGKQSLTNLISVYDPHQRISRGVYSYIANNLPNWIEKAIENRTRAGSTKIRMR